MRVPESPINAFVAEWEDVSKKYMGRKVLDVTMEDIEKDLQNLITKYISKGIIRCDNPFRVEAYLTVSNKIKFTYNNTQLQQLMYAALGEFGIEIGNDETV